MKQAAVPRSKPWVVEKGSRSDLYHFLVTIGKLRLVGRVTPCAPSWRTSRRSLAGGGAHGVRPTRHKTIPPIITNTWPPPSLQDGWPLLSFTSLRGGWLISHVAPRLKPCAPDVSPAITRRTQMVLSLFAYSAAFAVKNPPVLAGPPLKWSWNGGVRRAVPACCQSTWQCCG